MKRYLAVPAVLVSGLLTCLLCGISLAQEQEEELKYSWGTVSSLSSKQIVITEYDYDADEEVDVTYILDPNVKLHNVNSLKDIVIGNDVWIDYVTRGSGKVAMGIELKKASDEEEYTPPETYEEDSEYFPEAEEEELEY